MTSTLTRRGLVTAAPAAIIAGTLPANAVDTKPDAALLILREPYERKWQAYVAALKQYSAAEAAASNLADLPRSDPRRIAAEERYDVADVLADQAGDAHRAIVEEICRRPARTIDGLAFKARVSLKHEDNRLAELVTSIMDDILAIGGAHA